MDERITPMATKLGIVNTIGADPKQHSGLLRQAPLEGCRQISCLEDLPAALEWGLAQQSTVLLRVCTNRVDDAALRRHWRDALINASARGGTTDG